MDADTGSDEISPEDAGTAGSATDANPPAGDGRHRDTSHVFVVAFDLESEDGEVCAATAHDVINAVIDRLSEEGLGFWTQLSVTTDEDDEPTERRVRVAWSGGNFSDGRLQRP